MNLSTPDLIPVQAVPRIFISEYVVQVPGATMAADCLAVVSQHLHENRSLRTTLYESCRSLNPSSYR
jgi:hypothetical protein